MTEKITSDSRDAITPLQLKQAMDAGQQLFILDVRNSHEFRQWRIEGKQDVEVLHIPYFAFIEDPDAIIARVPRDRHISVVRAKGGASEFVAEMLRERGFQTSNLVGGMVAWGNSHQTTELLSAIAGQPDMQFYQINRFGKGCLSYLIGSAGQAIVVDPSRHADAYIRLAEENGFEMHHVFDTHLHADHLSGGRLLADHVRATYHIQASEGELGCGGTG